MTDKLNQAKFAQFIEALDAADSAESETSTAHNSSVSTRDWEAIRSLTGVDDA